MYEIYHLVYLWFVICSAMTSSIGQEDTLPVKEVLLTGVGHKNKKPLLIAFVEQDLLIYEAFTFADSSLEGHLNLRFKKVCV